MQFIEVEVTEVSRPAQDVVILYFSVPGEADEDFNYNPGQHIVIRQHIEGKEYRRPYALMSSPFTGERLAIAIRRISNGMVSGFFHEHAQPGMKLEISYPQGFFFAEINALNVSTCYLYAHGIGIVPLLSIAKSMLSAESVTRVFLYYESKDESQRPFRSDIELLEEAYPNRFKVIQLHTMPGLISGLLSTFTIKSKFESPDFIKQLLPSIKERGKSVHFICGSGTMVNHLKKSLIESGIRSDQINTEYIYIKSEDDTAVRDGSRAGIEVESKVINGNRDKSILDVLIEDDNLEPPFACRKGLCGTCAARLIDGRVEMPHHRALGDEDVKKGWILTCQSYPLTDSVKIKFEPDR